MIPRLFSYFLLVVLVAINAAVDSSFVEEIRKVLAKRPLPLAHYTWVEDDVPETFPLINARPQVYMSIEESVRYGVTSPESYWEWLYTSTSGDVGSVHMGPNQRFGVISFTHELHCMRSLHKALSEVEAPFQAHNLHHTEHCLSFMRQQIMCAADITLEPGDAFSRNFTAHRVTGDMRCMDVEAFYSSMWEQYQNWLAYQEQQPA